VLKCVASVLQVCKFVVVFCNVSQSKEEEFRRAEVFCSLLQSVASAVLVFTMCCSRRKSSDMRKSVASVLQVCCSVLQRVAVVAYSLDVCY